MPRPRLPEITFVLATTVLITSVIVGARFLPEHIATHFDASGNADGWMSREAHVTAFLSLGLGVSAFVLGLVYSIRFFPAATLNVPHAEDWRQPAHHARACDYLFRHTLWLATLQCLLFTALHVSIVFANTTTPPSLPTRTLGLSVGLFLTGLCAWIFLLIRFFRHPPRTRAPAP